jgi:amino-acid N-acetyltransferase
LPTSDIDEDKLLYLLWEDGQPIGTGGLEIFDDCGLLRSVTVISEKQNAGYGSFIIQQLERFAFDSGISCMYLLTNTAEKFFDRKGYCKISRENVPDTIKRTSEYSELCPSTAVVMNKVLS